MTIRFLSSTISRSIQYVYPCFARLVTTALTSVIFFWETQKVADTPNGPDAFLSDSDPSELEVAGQSRLHYSHSHSRYNDDSSADPESLTMHSSTSNSNSKTKRKSGSIKSGSLISTDLSHSRRHPELGGERVRLDSIVDLDEEGDGGCGKNDTTKRRREEDEPLELAPVHLDSRDKVHTPGSGRFEVL